VRNAYKMLTGKSERKEAAYGDIDVDGKSIFKKDS
jgi:hypothetical protein